MADVNNYNTTPNDANNTGVIVAVILILIILVGGYFAFARNGNVTTTNDTAGMDANTSGSAQGTAGTDNGGYVGGVTVTNSTTTTVTGTSTNP